MKTLILFMVLCAFFSGCREEHNRSIHSLSEDAYMKDSTMYPLFIDGGTKVVYQFGHLTPDKGLKLYFDTIPHPAGGLKLDDSLRKRLAVAE